MKQKMKYSVLIAGLLALGLIGCQKQEETPAPVVIQPEAPAPQVPIEPMPETPAPEMAPPESMPPAEPAPGDMPGPPPAQ